MLSEAVFHILVVYLHKVFKGHRQIGLLGFQKISFPFFGVPLELKTSLLFLFSGSRVVRVVAFYKVCSALFVFKYWHNFLPFLLGGMDEGKGFDNILLLTYNILNKGADS